jgi:hypothetical protein
MLKHSLVGRRTVLCLLIATTVGVSVRVGDAATAAPPSSLTRPILRVPHTAQPLAVNAELEGKKVWEADAGNTRNFETAPGRGMVPYTEAKARWGKNALYLVLYAGDLDLQGSVTKTDGPVENDDAFRLEFGDGADRRIIAVSVLGTVADARCTTMGGKQTCDPRWKSGVTVAVDRDGTLNKVGDNDEEWVVEMAIPFASLGVHHPTAGTRIPVSISRCEVARDGKRGCGSWGRTPRGELVLEP